MLWRHTCSKDEITTVSKSKLHTQPRKHIVFLPGGIAKLPFMKGGLANAGIACKGGLNCIVGETGCAARTNTPRSSPGAAQDKD